MRACLDRIAARDPELRAWAHVDAEAALAQARDRDGEPSRGPLHGIPVGVKDVIDTADLPTVVRLGDLRGAPARARRGLRRVAARGGRGRARQDRHDGVRHLRAAADGQPARPGTHAGRVLERLGGRGRRRHGAARARDPDGRLRDPPGLLLRDRRLQAGARLALDRRDQAAERPPRHARAARLQRRGRGAAGWVGRAAAARAAGGVLPHAVVGPARGGRPSPARGRRRAAGRGRARAAAGVRRSRRGAGDRHGLRRGSQPRAGVARAPRRALVRAARLPRARARRLERGRRGGGRARGALPGAAAGRLGGFDALLVPGALGEAPLRTEGHTGDPLLCRAWTLLGVPAISVPGPVGPAGMPIGVQLVGVDEAAVLGAATWVEGALGLSGRACTS